MSDYSLSPDFVLEEEVKYNTLVSNFENGVEQRRSKWASPLRTFRLVYKNRSTSDFTTVRDFLIAKLGALTSFTWTNPNDSVEYTVRFKEDSMNYNLKAFGIYDFEMSFIQVK